MKTITNTKAIITTKNVSVETEPVEVKAKKPMPKLQEANKTIINVNSLPENPTPYKDPSYQYDTLGNVLGFYIAPKNVVTEDDTVEEKNIKIAAQQASLPCKGPKPRFR